MTDQLAVVTVTYSSGDYVKSFLDTLALATDADPRVVIADNGSTDGAPEAAERDYPRVTLLHTGANLGYGGAINRAVAEIDPEVEFVVVANPDVAWGPGSLDELVAAARRWPRAGSLGPLIREPDGSVYPSARQVPKLVSGTGHALLGAVWKNNPFTRAYLDEERTDTERPVGWLSGSCLLLRREAFDAVDGFDSRYFMYMEDVDLGDRLGRAGWQNVFVPSAEILHTKGHAASKNPELMLPAHHRSAYQFQADRNPGPLRAPLRWGLRAGLAIRSRVAVRLARRELDRAARSGDGADLGGHQ
ncbi:dTDP-rhamnose--alpha-D-N-acetylglucosamine-diphosphoryl polyprenol, alpha-3-L-rhamnosyl transferase [Gordonia araii NBRC 100433]|uniref:dTDP-rhamnose--alpha-D-N-acetylglucosamine-diphosphoryl polyprenol, alpha-3-L-rhamnosyl transferase n=1 Tax=Gordonia araii NBRC 100433 TaxID=1073574 RepID=G7GYQ5_9ACTN|nr:glycosyltransferase family 2 protein [Gordonia araii]NNG98969.1 glycosyltransferase family 2 protein [Gordonia araii NBRC 100433]GAB08730.1 dTDP-rhamnose--alpha-D-N-acetylglucosamine-diphosphoryl polyprenol, alpha-3-L-rhamnosyl transferase [Gordonia araii NBRC 100433]